MTGIDETIALEVAAARTDVRQLIEQMRERGWRWMSSGRWGVHMVCPNFGLNGHQGHDLSIMLHPRAHDYVTGRTVILKQSGCW